MAVVAAGLGRPAEAGMFFTAREVGSDVTISGSGSINTNGLILKYPSMINMGAEIRPLNGTFVNGSPYNVSADLYSGTVVSPVFGTTWGQDADSGTGGLVGRPGNPAYFAVPPGYTSGLLLVTTSTYNSSTFASLGMTPGTYVWSWGSGANADTMTLVVVPEPSTLALLCMGVLGLLLHTRRRR